MHATTTLPDRVLFMADVHLGLPGETPERIAAVAAFLRDLRGTISHLYIVGDLFDFWFEYRSVVPSVAPRVVFELYNLVQTGTAVTLFAGNHDFWVGPYLMNDVGIRFVPDDLTVEHQGLTIYLHHGDGLYPDDRGYRLLKRIIRHPATIRAFRLLHPDFGRRIANLTSKTSREYLAPPSQRMDGKLRQLRDAADNKLGIDCNAVVYGHSHYPLVEMRQGGTLVLLGDWVVKRSYVLLENSQFSLRFVGEGT